MWPCTATPSVSPLQAAEKMRIGNAAFIDVRTPNEYQHSHAQGAINIPLNTLSISDFERLKHHAEVYVICLSGTRSATATTKLRRANIPAFTITGGTTAWQASGLPME